MPSSKPIRTRARRSSIADPLERLTDGTAPSHMRSVIQGRWVNAPAAATWCVGSWLETALYMNVGTMEIRPELILVLQWVGAWCFSADHAQAWAQRNATAKVNVMILQAPFWSRMIPVDWKSNLLR